MGKIKKRHRFRNFILVVCTLIICLGLATGTSLYNYMLKLSNQGSSQADKIKPKAVSKDEPVNILAMGVDIGVVGAEDKDNLKRTDTILLINYNPKLEEANVISIPRDTLIEVNKKYKKINEANVIGGPAFLIDAVENMLNIKVNYYGKVDYAGFRNIVDIIGPIEVKINNKMDYDDPTQNLHIHFKKGETVQLDGKKAEEFFRWRKNNDGTGLADGDLGRIENQHLFLNKVIDKFKNPSIITKIPSILASIPNYVETNMSAQDMVKNGYSLVKLDKTKINMYTLKGDAEYISGVSYLIYDEKKNKDVLMKLHNETAKK
ncbi:cell envelope-like function transcriptional attenuator common domain protein [Clostridiales bacterium oral taxon 876 str. F0540]|nr:cell envelope-like function transcriptional attenuator common domain protein [Clostridiales bacterium oral taxon 876 str. F0540]